MLKSKHMVILVVVLAVLVGVSLMQKADHRRETALPATTVLLDGQWTADDLGRLDLGFDQDDQAVTLEQGPDGWVVSSYWGAKASRDRVDTVLRTLGGLEGEFRSDSADVLDDYGLDTAQSVRIRGFDRQGVEAFALDAGVKVLGGQGQFVRLPGEDAVYLTPTNILGPLGLHQGPARPGSRHFLHLEVVKEDRTAVDEIILVDGAGERRLVKEFAVPEPAPGDTSGVTPEPDRLTWEWRLTTPTDEPLAKTRADGVLGSLVTVRGVDIEDPTADPADYGLAEPERRATLVFADGRRLTLEFGATREAAPDRPVGVRMRLVGDPTVWVVTEYTVNNIFKATEDLRPES
ncbi:MAG: DUF4340 domain-containing protein [bacterium]|nr:DUF4340 domain-containing protein [bacterium]